MLRDEMPIDYMANTPQDFGSVSIPPFQNFESLVSEGVEVPEELKKEFWGIHKELGWTYFNSIDIFSVLLYIDAINNYLKLANHVKDERLKKFLIDRARKLNLKLHAKIKASRSFEGFERKMQKTSRSEINEPIDLSEKPFMSKGERKW